MYLLLNSTSPKLNFKRLITFTVMVMVFVLTVTPIAVPGDSRNREWRSRPVVAYSPALPIAPAPPQGSGYTYRRTITIDHTKVPNTDQSNFPLLISGTYSYLATVANGGNVQNANGYDVIFTSDTGCATKLDHQVESYSATTGAVNYWVRVPSLSHTNDTTIYLCYGNSAITTDQSNKTGVWDSNFKAVYHLNDQAANTSVADSTANASNGVNGANTSGKSVSGKLGKALNYNGSSDYTTAGVTQTTSFTWECWFKLTDWTTQAGSSNYSTLMAAVYGSGGPLLMLWKDNGWLVHFATDNPVDGLSSGANSVAPGSWHHAAYTRSGNSGTYALYLDGVWKWQVTSGTNNGNSTVTLGTRADYTSQALNGILDEARISNVARSADWIKTEYNNQSSPATFYTISAVNNCCDTSTSRLDPMNATGGGGENPLSRNFNWTLPLVNLKGRAGMDLSLSLSYNSLVWTKSGSYISFDDDHGFPGPGFRLGFPVIQPLYYNTETARYAFLLIASDGSRVELRQVGTSSLYESADSSHLLLDATTMVLRTTDGTQLKYELKGSEFACTEVKDRNGNYLTVNYTSLSHIDNVIDTLGRTIQFNYDANGWLSSITQTWNPGAVTHNWATFNYMPTTIQTNFSGLTVSGPSNGSSINTLQKVTLTDGSHYDFSWTSWGQVWKISESAADNHLLNYRSYNLPQTNTTAQTECPRFTERRDWAQYWNGDTDGISATNEEVVTSFAAPVADTWTMPTGSPYTTVSGKRADVTSPDGVVNKIYFIDTVGSTPAQWQRGLPALTITYDSGGTWRRKSMSVWTQDNTTLSYILNPRITETDVYDPEGNRARVEITYQQVSFANGTSCQLPRDVYEYAANASDMLRSTRTIYNTNAVYTDRRIIGLASEKLLYEGNINNGGTLRSKLAFFYDNENGSSSIQGTDAPIRHDNTNYSAAFVTGRANLSSVRRYDVTDLSFSTFTTTRTQYNTAGATVSVIDALTHTVQLSYSDSFSDSANLNTLAYPTKITDPDSYISTTKYDYDFGAVTYQRTPKPNITQPNAESQLGPEQTFTYDPIGRLQQTTNLVNNAYTRFEYPGSQIRVDAYATIQEGLGEAHSFRITDGTGRVIATAMEHPGSPSGGFSGQKFVYDVLGRTIKISNPAETTAVGAPSQWTTAGDDAASGWIYTQQTYDWKSRPLITTNQDGTTKTASYAGCGCAGGEVVTLTDEGTLDGGVAKRRQQKIYTDVLGRVYESETLNWEAGSVYSTTVTSFNARDQVTNIREYAGAEGSGTYQDTSMSYDGYGRLQGKHVPEQNFGTATVWTYNADDTVSTITDARGAVATFAYTGTNRHLVKTITHTLSGSPTINVAFEYDAAGNRTSMSDGLGSVTYDHNLLSQLTSETRTITGVGSFALTYAYNLSGQLSSITDPFGEQVGYSHDKIGRLSAVTGANFPSSVTSYASQLQYRAWGALKSLSYGDTKTLTVGYDSKLNASTYEIPGLIKKSYQYYDDGRLKFTQDQFLTNSRFDRLYKYDHIGDITSALTGAEARGQGPTNDRPYNETMTYDPMGHLTLRNVYQWDRHQSTGNEIYVNNRNQYWQYDADGRILSGNSTYTYDAAGEISSFGDSDPYMTDQTLDGDGRRIKSVLRSYDINTNQWTIEKITYYIHSSVIGQPINEVDANGAYRTFVFGGGGDVIAIQSSDPSFGQSMSFEHYDASGATYRPIDPQGNGLGAAELDPYGADAGTMKPFTWPPPSSPGKLEPYYGIPELNSTYSGCVLDRVPVPCDIYNSLLNNGGVQEEYLGPVEKKAPPKLHPAEQPPPKPRIELVIARQDIVPHGLGIFTIAVPMWVPDNEGGHGGWVRDTFANEQNTTPPKSSCSKVVDDLVNRAPYLLPGSRSKAMADIGRSMAYLAVNTFGKGHDDPKLTTDGFKNDLVKDGQGGDVYKHIYGHAGAMLIGNSGARLPIFGKSGYQYTDENLALDIDQRDHPEKYPGHSAAEAATEVRDDYAARDIGRLMGQRMHGNISRDDLRQRIFSILCEH